MKVSENLVYKLQLLWRSLRVPVFGAVLKHSHLKDIRRSSRILFKEHSMKILVFRFPELDALGRPERAKANISFLILRQTFPFVQGVGGGRPCRSSHTTGQEHNRRRSLLVSFA